MTTVARVQNMSSAKSTKTTSKTTLSRDQQTKLLLKPCRTRNELKAWIKYFLSLELPDCTVSRYSDTNPLEVIWEVYDICVNKNNPEKIQELLFVAGRGSGKTLGMAIAELMVLLHDQRDVVHVGAIQNQAERCYAYQKNFLFNRKLKPLVMPSDTPEDKRIAEKLNMSKSTFNIAGEKITLEVLPCTLKACLTTNAIVKTQFGDKKITEIKPGDFIYSGDGSLVEVVENNIDYQECIRIELDDGRIIEGTIDHKIWTNKGWVQLKDLTDEYEVL
jgi:hypothetical protein